MHSSAQYLQEVIQQSFCRLTFIHFLLTFPVIAILTFNDTDITDILGRGFNG